MQKPSLREQRRAARAAKLLRRRLILGAIIIVILGLIAYAVYVRIQKNQDEVPPTTKTNPAPETTATFQLFVEDIVVGNGPEVMEGDRISVHYVGKLDDGTIFDSSRERGKPFEFVLGTGEVIPGWDKGLVGMRVGGIRRLVIPPEMAYGSTGFGDVIPPNATLTFEIELLDIILGVR